MQGLAGTLVLCLILPLSFRQAVEMRSQHSIDPECSPVRCSVQFRNPASVKGDVLFWEMDSHLGEKRATTSGPLVTIKTNALQASSGIGSNRSSGN